MTLETHLEWKVLFCRKFLTNGTQEFFTVLSNQRWNMILPIPIIQNFSTYFFQFWNDDCPTLGYFIPFCPCAALQANILLSSLVHFTTLDTYLFFPSFALLLKALVAQRQVLPLSLLRTHRTFHWALLVVNFQLLELLRLVFDFLS